jgi:hypothetical protein
MAYMTVSHWSATEMNDEMMATATEKFPPMIMAAGASAVQMIQTSDLSISVITHYADAATASAAQAKIAGIRAQAATDFPMTMDSVHAGEVFATA